MALRASDSASFLGEGGGGAESLSRTGWLRAVQAAPASHFDRSAGALENAEIHNERLTGQCFLDPRAKRGGSCPTTDPEITEKLLRCPQ